MAMPQPAADQDSKNAVGVCQDGAFVRYTRSLGDCGGKLHSNMSPDEARALGHALIQQADAVDASTSSALDSFLSALS